MRELTNQPSAAKTHNTLMVVSHFCRFYIIRLCTRTKTSGYPVFIQQFIDAIIRQNLSQFTICNPSTLFGQLIYFSVNYISGNKELNQRKTRKKKKKKKNNGLQSSKINDQLNLYIVLLPFHNFH